MCFSGPKLGHTLLTNVPKVNHNHTSILSDRLGTENNEATLPSRQAYDKMSKYLCIQGHKWACFGTQYHECIFNAFRVFKWGPSHSIFRTSPPSRCSIICYFNRLCKQVIKLALSLQVVPVVLPLLARNLNYSPKCAEFWSKNLTLTPRTYKMSRVPPWLVQLMHVRPQRK